MEKISAKPPVPKRRHSFAARLRRVLSAHEFALFLTGLSLVFISFTVYMMHERYAVLAENYARAQHENGELRVLLNAENLAEGESRERLERYRKFLLEKYGEDRN